MDATPTADTTAVRRRAKRRVADPRREQLVAAAIEAIEAEGPTVGTAQIAERAGVPRPHVYRHFASKEQIEEEVTRVAAADLIERIRPAMSTRGTLEEIARAAVSAAVGWAAEHSNLYRFIAARQQTRALHRTRLGRGRFLDMLVESITAYLREDESDHDVRVPDGVLAGLIGLVDATIIWWLDHRDEEQDAVVDRMARHVALVLADVLTRMGLPVSGETLLGENR